MQGERMPVPIDPRHDSTHEATETSITERGSGTVQRAAAQPPDVDVREADASDSLHRARASFYTLIEIFPELVVLHRDGQILYANPAVVGALGVEAGSDIAGSPLAGLFHPDDLPTVNARLLSPAANATHEMFGLRWRRKEGGYRATEAMAARVDFEGAEAVLVVARDVSERVEFQHQLLHRDRMAALGTLSAGVAHEINNPLTYLLVNLEYVLRRLRAVGASDDPGAELGTGVGNGAFAALVLSLQHAVDGANRVRQIVRDLLTFSQGNVEQRGMTDVRGIVESAIQMAWHEIRHRARLVKRLAEVPPVDANEARLGQVFLNLLVNAAQAIPEGHADEHEICVVTRTDERGNANVEVSDTGLGIAPEDMPRIFDPFFTTKGEGGTGLGLAISHGTIKVLGGEIQVKSVPGQGTTFRVVLPPAKPWRSSVTASRAHDLRVQQRPRLLIIDDERLVADAIARVLAEDNDVEVVTDARQALARIAAGELYDVVLCDLMMPVMTGMDLYAEVVRSAPKLAPHIVFMTGGAFTPRARAFVESVVNQCLEKPLDMSKLRSLLARAARE
jgi:PAS domain S-box-containing protein